MHGFVSALSAANHDSATTKNFVQLRATGEKATRFILEKGTVSLNVTLVLRWLELGFGSVSLLLGAAHTPEAGIPRRDRGGIALAQRSPSGTHSQ